MKTATHTFRVLDLFAGMGGLSYGFAREGFSVTGVDVNPYTGNIFRLNGLGESIITDLRTERITGKYDILLAGPPCRPWSSINVRRRGERHPDHDLIRIIAEHIMTVNPLIFVIENVPPARRDIEREISLIHGYRWAVKILRYSDFGAATARRRLFVVGVRDDLPVTPDEIFTSLERFRREPLTVRDAIGKDFTGDPQHVYPVFRTVERYMDLYRTGRFGWYVLEWDRPAPSFGNIMKTYILHPGSFNGGPRRVISVREALCIMGFPEDFQFPPGMPLSLRYQMIADAVSPVFSCALARVIGEMLEKLSGRRSLHAESSVRRH